MNIYNLTFSCDVYVCVHVEIYIYTRLRLPFRKGTRIFNISFSSFPSIFLHSLLPVFPLLSFLPCNRIGIYKYLQPKELTSYTYTYIPYSNSKSFEKSSHPIFVFNETMESKILVRKFANSTRDHRNSSPFPTSLPRVIQ